MGGRSDDEVWFWYQTIKKIKKEGSSAQRYCKEHGLDIKKYWNLKRRMFFIKDSEPEHYKELMNHVVKCRQSFSTIRGYSKKHNIKYTLFVDANNHYGYLQIIERLEKEHANDKEGEMSFIPVPASATKLVRQTKIIKPPFDNNQSEDEHEGEFLGARNAIELVITKGVKVSVSPDVDSMKIIKIIELLKDL